MRFLELEFPAYGPFTDFRLHLDPGPGLYLVYGPNESGKSSALRAVRGLLYGIPGDGRDEFLHPGDGLRLRAILQRASGEKLAFGRRKGRGKKTLIDTEGKAQDPELLDAFLGGVDSGLFDRLYGLDHVTLSQGGKALLEEGGRIGESLFAAGLGPGFRKVRDALKAEAGDLFKATSRTLVVNKAIEDFRLAQKRAADLSVSAESWRKLSTELDEEIFKARALEVETRDLDAARQRLVRYLDAHKPVTQRESLTAELADLAELPELSLDFASRRHDVQGALAPLRLALSKAEETEKELSERKDALADDDRLLAFAAGIDRLHRSLDAVAETEAALPVTMAGQEAIASRLSARATDLGLEERHLGKLPEAPQRAKARRLAERYRRLKDDEQALQGQLASQRRQASQLAERAQALGELPETVELEASLGRLRKALGLDAEIAERERTLTARSTALSAALQTLPAWKGSLEELGAMTVPTHETVETFERREAELSERLKKLESDLEDLVEKGRQTREQLARMRDDERVRSRDDLRQVREHREAAWKSLLDAWEEGASAGAALPQRSVLERAQGEADGLADKLLDEAAKVAELERLQRELLTGRERWMELEKLRKIRHAEREESLAEWASLWSSEGLSLRPAVEMRAWLGRREALLLQATEARSGLEGLEEMRGRRAEQLAQQTRIWQTLLAGQTMGPSVGEAVELAESRLTPLLGQAEEQRRLRSEDSLLRIALAETESTLANTDSDLAVWRAEWGQVATAFHRDASTDPSDLETLLNAYEELRGLLDEQERASRQVNESSAQLAAFAQSVDDLAADLGESPGDDRSAFVERLVRDLAEVRRVSTLREELAERLEAVRRDAADALANLQMRESQWDLLLAEAGTSDAEGLPELEARVDRRRQVVERLRDIEDGLRPLAAGQSTDEFARSLQEIDWDTVPGQIRDLDRKLEALESERSLAWQRKGQIEQELRGFDGAEQAALAAQDAADAMSEGKAAVARYVRLTLAEAVLKREMERYRRENEGPVLREASSWFARLTCGAYSGLSVGLDPRNDAPRLEAVSTSGRQVAVEGLSDGTRDQLFLALRLATISQSTGASEPMPMVMDDVLVHFDTARARATLEVLAEFGKTTQVLLFTHLERDKLLAESLAGGLAGVITLESLGL